jgi:hypothetical protein
MFEIVGQRSGGLIARVTVGLQTASDDYLQIAVERRCQ